MIVDGVRTARSGCCRRGCSSRSRRRCSSGRARGSRRLMESAARRRRQHGRAGRARHHRGVSRSASPSGSLPLPSQHVYFEAGDRDHARPPRQAARGRAQGARRPARSASCSRCSRQRSCASATATCRRFRSRRCASAMCSSCAPATALPVDGRVLTGESAVNEAMLTGESAPVAKAPGDRRPRRHRERARAAALRGDCRGPGDAARRRSSARSRRRRGRRRRCSGSSTACRARFVPAVLAIAAVTLRRERYRSRRLGPRR